MVERVRCLTVSYLPSHRNYFDFFFRRQYTGIRIHINQLIKPVSKIAEDIATLFQKLIENFFFKFFFFNFFEKSLKFF